MEGNLDIPRRKAEEEENDCPIEEVRLTVPITDDPTLPCLTFRTWVLGIASCVFLAFVNMFFGYRQNQLGIGSIVAQVVVLPIARLMAATLPVKPIRLPLTKWSFSLNPGPFNLKEHALITIFARAGSGGVYAMYIINIVKVFYHRDIHPMAAFLLAQTTQMLGYGWAGIFRKYLVESPYMWWPSDLVQVSLFRAFHENEGRVKGGLTRLQFFLIVMISSFAYYLVPNYFMPSITALSLVCWIWKKSVTAQQIGAGNWGLGVGSIALDWSAISSFTGSPLVTPGTALVNLLVGFILIVYIVTPIAYWNNWYDAKKYPIFSSSILDSNGNYYNITRVIKSATFEFDQHGYDSYSPINLSIFFTFSYGFGFAALGATLSHVFLFNGSSIWQLWRKGRQNGEEVEDVHNRLMKAYNPVPQWWFHLLLVLVVSLAIFTCEGFGKQLQLPYWGVFLACALALVYTLPVGVIYATTNQQPGLNIITEMIIGYIMPGKPLANVVFKTYGYISMGQALFFLEDFKLGHYMKIPPRSMFSVQLVGTVLSSAVYFGTGWWLLTTVPNICDLPKLPEGSPWTCPSDHVFFSASVIWGLVGPLRMFGKLGNYVKLNWFFLVGLLSPLPVYILSRFFPDKKWIPLINMPVIWGATGNMPPGRAVNFISFFVMGFIFNCYVYMRFKAWWGRHNYILAAGLDAGIALMGILMFCALQNFNIYGMNWWGLENDDHCPLASCPTAPGMVKEGCPVF